MSVLHLLPDEQGGALGFVLPYLDAETRDWLQANPVTINYFDHNWRLNDAALSE